MTESEYPLRFYKACAAIGLLSRAAGCRAIVASYLPARRAARVASLGSAANGLSGPACDDGAVGPVP